MKGILSAKMATKKTATKKTATKKTAAPEKAKAPKKAKSRAEDAFVPLATSLPELPDVPQKSLAGLAAKVKKAKDVYRKRNIIEELVPYGDRAKLYGALLRHGVLPFWDEPLLWDVLAAQRKGDTGAITPKDVAFLLSKVTRYSHQKNDEPTLTLPSWPKDLDDLVLPAYVEDKAAFADCESFAEPVKKGFLTVLVRAGVLTPASLGPEFVGQLAKLHLQSYGLPSKTNFVQEGAHWIYDEMYDKQGHPTKDFWDFIGIFTTKEQFLEALDEAASAPAFVDQHNSALLMQQIDVLRRAPIERLARHLSKTGLNDHSTTDLHALLRSRSDSPAELFQLARLLKESDSLKSEVALVEGVLRAKERGESVPVEVDALFSMDSVQTGYKPIDPVLGADELVAALQVLGKERAAGVVKAVVEHEYRYISAFSVLHAFTDERAIVDRAFQRLATYAYASREIFMGISQFGTAHLDLLAQKHDLILQQGGPARAELVQRGIQGVLAKAAQRGESWDERFDRFLSIHGFEKDIDGKPSFNVDYDFSHYIAPVILVAATGLSPERRRAWVKANLDPQKASFARIFACVPRDDDALLTEVFAFIASHDENVRMAYRDWLSDLARELGPRALPHARFLLEKTKSQRFRKSFEDALGTEELEDALAGSAAADVRKETKIEKILRLSKAVGGPTETISILEIVRDDEDDEDDEEEPGDIGLTHVGGPGFDLGERTPQYEGEAMTHILTLATAEIPHLKNTFPEAEAVALYLANPEMNEAFESYTKETAVVVLSPEDTRRPLAKPTSQDLEPRAIRVTNIVVPSRAFHDNGDPNAKEVHDAIFQVAGRVGGDPIWLQSEEDGGEFLFQFHEGLASINLGDCGVMYVFDDTAYWQCY